MRLLVGGYAQGKLEYAMQLTGAGEAQILRGESCALTAEQNGAVLDGVHALVRRCMEAGVEPLGLIEALLARNPELVITAQELGCGIVPLDRFEREWRECAGRVCCALAQRATQVERVCCGVAQRMK